MAEPDAGCRAWLVAIGITILTLAWCQPDSLPPVVDQAAGRILLLTLC